MDFTTEINVDWITNTETRAYVEDKLTFNIAENTSYDNREGIITFTSKDGKLKQEVKVYQAQTNAIVLSQKNYTFDCNANSFDVIVKANVRTDVKCNIDWIHLIETRGLTENTYHFAIDSNTGYEGRTGTIKIVNLEKNLSETITITQTQKDALMIGKSQYNIKQSGGNIELTVGHNVDFTTETDVNWINKIETRAFVENKLTFNVAENTSYDNRRGKITFTSKDGKLKQEVIINQDQKDMLELLTPSNYIAQVRDNITVQLRSNIEYDVKTNEDWITLEKIECSGRERTLYFSLALNKNNEARKGTITISSKDNRFKEIITINQAGIAVSSGEWIDLGLPSGILWASHNVGATKPEEYGDYFAWGEISPKPSYIPNNSDHDKIKTEHSGDPKYDAATANWGVPARMPKQKEVEELALNCTTIWTKENGVYGRLVIGPNGNSIFLPASGYRAGTSLDEAGQGGWYCVSTPSGGSYNGEPYNMRFDSKEFYSKREWKGWSGCTVRPVRYR